MTATHTSLAVREFKHFQKNTLQAFLSLELPSGMVLHGCTLHQKNGSRWIGVPARQYEKSDHEKSCVPLIEFASKEHSEKFQAAALAAIDRIFGRHNDATRDRRSNHSSESRHPERG